MNQSISGNLIKGHESRTSKTARAKTGVIKNQIIAAQNEAQKIRQDAEEYAAKLKAEAQNQATNLKMQAYQAGSEKALQELFSNLLESREIREKIWRDTEKDMLRLAVRLAEKIIGREIDQKQETVIEIIANAVQNARQQEKLTIKVNPKDLPFIEKHNERISAGSKIKFIDFVADPRISDSGCLIESEVGTIDARLETQLRVLERALLTQSDGENDFE